MTEVGLKTGIGAMRGYRDESDFKSEDAVPIKNIQETASPPREAVVVVIPAFNEERFIGSVVLLACKYAATVIVVDDGSSDFTAEVAAASGAVVVKHTQNQGKGSALSTGFHIAQGYDPKVVVTLDADGQHMPVEIGQVVAPIIVGEADIVVGSRYLQPTSSVPLHRIMGHWAFNLLTRIGSGVSSTDSQSGFRAFSPAALEKINFRSKSFSVESEMQFIANENDLRLVEVPITIRYMDKPKRSVVAHGLIVLNGVLKLVGQYRPLLYFGLPGFTFVLMGLLWGLKVVERYETVHRLAIGYALISVLFTMLGMTLLSTGISLHSIRGLLIDLFQQNGNHK